MRTLKIGRNVGVFLLLAGFLVAFAMPAAAVPADTCPGTTVSALPYADSMADTSTLTADAELVSSCDSDPDYNNQHSAWYVWNSGPTPPASVTVNTFGSDYDTVLAVFTGTCGSLAETTCNDDADGTWQSKATFTPVANTDYYIKVVGYDDTETGALQIGINQDFCPGIVPYSASSNEQYEASINEKGEVVWAEYNGATGYDQIIKDGAPLSPAVADAGFHEKPSVNNPGVIVWAQADASGVMQIKQRDAAGTVTSLTTDIEHSTDPDLNDAGDVVFARFVTDANGGHDQIIKRAAAGGESQVSTSITAWHSSPTINNSGEVCWSQYDDVTTETQIACAGGYLTTGAEEKYAPSVNDNGDIVFSQVDGTTGAITVWQDTIAAPAPAAVTTTCPVGDHLDPQINNCGDIVYTDYTVTGFSQVYLNGTGAGCIPDVTSVTPNSALDTALPVAITIGGVNFTGATAVTLEPGAIPLTGYTVDSDTQISASVPGGTAVGSYDVQVCVGTLCSFAGAGSGFDVTQACDPAVDAVTAFSVSWLKNGVPFDPTTETADVCDVLTITGDTQGTGCLVNYSWQHADFSVDPYWHQLGGGQFISTNPVTWTLYDNSNAGVHNYAFYVRNSEGALTMQSVTGTVNVVDTGGVCAPPANDPPGCDPATNGVTAFSINWLRNGSPFDPAVDTAYIGDLLTITGDTQGTGCNANYSWQYADFAVDAYWHQLGGGQFTGTNPVVWDTAGLAPATYNFAFYARNTEGALSMQSVTGTIAVAVPAGPSVILSSSPSGNQTVEHNQTFTSIDLTGSPSGFTPTSYLFEYNTDGGAVWNAITECPAGASALCAWNAENAGPGTYYFKVTADDGGQNATDQLGPVSLIRNPPVVTLSADILSPQAPPYSDVTLTATPQFFLNGNTAEYHYSYLQTHDGSGVPTGNTVYNDLCGTSSLYTSGTTCLFNASAQPAGTFDLKVDAGDLGTNTQLATDSITYVLSPAGPACDPGTEGVTAFSVSWLKNGVPFDPTTETADVCDVLTITGDTQGTGCLVNYSWQHADFSVDPYWHQLGGGQFTTTNPVTWTLYDNSNAGVHNYAFYARNSEGTLTMQSNTGTVNVVDTGGVCAPPANDPPGCDPATNGVTAFSVSWLKNGVPFDPSTETAVVGDVLTITGDTLGTGCNANYSWQYADFAVDPYWHQLGGGQFTGTNPVVWDTTALAPATYNFAFYARNTEGTLSIQSVTGTVTINP